MDPLSLLRAIIAGVEHDLDAASGMLPIGELRFIVETGSDLSASDLDRKLQDIVGSRRFLLESFGGELPGFLVLRFPGTESTLPQRDLFAIAYALADALGVFGVEPDLSTGFFVDPSPDHGGPGIESVPGTGNPCWVEGPPPTDREWALKTARIPGAWELSRGSDIIVAQPDSGIADHAELGAGMLRLDLSFDVLQGRPGAEDPLDSRAANPGHGTATASVVGSREGGMITGAAPRAQLVPIRCLNDVKIINTAPVTAAILHATSCGAHVVSMSLGGAPSRAMHAAIRAAIARDMLVVAAAGNCVRTVVWPARYDEVVAAAGTNIDDRPWKGSSRGAAVDISAPAEHIWRAQRASASEPRDGVAAGQGTSFAAALVAGIAALWLGHHGRKAVIAHARKNGTTVQALFKSAIRATARKPAEWNLEDFGPGVIDAAALLALALADIPIGRGEGLAASDAIMALLDEEMGPGLRDTAFQSERYGMEIATIALNCSSLGAPVTGLNESVKWPGTRPSPQLAQAVAASSDRRLKGFGVSVGTAVTRSALYSPGLAPSGTELPAGARTTIERVSRMLVERQGDNGIDADLMASLEQALYLQERGIRPPVAERMVGEALVRLSDRPALRVRGGRISTDTASSDTWRAQLLLLATNGHMDLNLSKVGRIDAGGAHVGTGFVAGTGLILTNRHVAQMFAAPVPRRDSPREWIMTEEVTIDFADEPSSETRDTKFKITGVVSAGPRSIEFDGVDLRHLDAAILTVETENDLKAPLPSPVGLETARGAADRGRAILVCGYPAPPTRLPFDPHGRIDSEVLRRLVEIYGTDYGTKYVAPGEIIGGPGDDPLDTSRWVLSHDATTLVGNSGSAVFSMTGRQDAVGLHFGGRWMRANFAHCLPAVRSDADLTRLGELNWGG